MRAVYHHRTQGRDVEAVHILGLSGGLQQLGYEVEVVGPPGVVTDPNSTASPHLQKPRTFWGKLARSMPQIGFELMEIGYNFAALPRLMKRATDRDTRLLYERYALFNAAGVLAGRLTGTPVVLEVNETARVDRLRNGKRLIMKKLACWVEDRILSSATGVVVVSNYLRDQLIAAGVPADKIRTTPNAVDVSRFDPEKVNGVEIRERYGFVGKTVIGFAGCFARWHGVCELIRAAAELMGRYPDARLLLVGDGAERPAAEALCRELGIADRVAFTGRIPHAEMPAHMAAMDIGVMPASNVYGSPMKVFEYMAMGRPAVAPRYEPLEEAVADGETGLLFEPSDERGLVRCLEQLLADPARRGRLGAAARRKVLNQHQWVHNAQEVVNLANREPAEQRPAAAPSLGRRVA